MISIYIVPLVVLALLLIGYPVYFIVGRVRAKREGCRGPSVVTAAAWVGSAVMLVWVSAPALPPAEEKPKYEEARRNLRAIYETQVSYQGEAGEYSSYFTLLHWEPEGLARYTYYAPKEDIQPVYGPFFPYHHDGDWPFSVRPEANVKGFTNMAVGNIDGDSLPDVWLVNDTGALVNLVNDTADNIIRERQRQAEIIQHRAPFLLASLLVFIGLAVRDVVVIRRGKRQKGKLGTGEA